MSLLFYDYAKSELNFVRIQNNFMSRLSEDGGFLTEYQSILHSFRDSRSAFNYLNFMYRSLFGELRYESFESFQSACLKNASDNVDSPQFLKCWFMCKGFDCWISFKAIVMHYYPETNQNKLIQFWYGQYYDDGVVKIVGYVKQIIG